jgi:hypothetical protein
MGYSSPALINDERVQRDVDVLAEFISIYCSAKHEGEKAPSSGAGGIVGRYLAGNTLRYCRNCQSLLLHAVSKRVLCPYDPKPSCKKCPAHCYGEGYRERIREVMRFSGMELIRRGRFSLIKKYLF